MQPMAPREALVIVNPAAGSFGDEGTRPQLSRALQRAGLPGEWEETTPERGPAVIIADHPGEGPVVVLGGDGTVQDAAGALVGGDRPLAIVPMGTGNVLALRLSIPVQLEQALRVAVQGQVRRVDVGFLGEDPFLLGVGMGIDGRVVRAAARSLKKQFGKLAYVWSAVKNLPVQHHDFVVEVDGERREHRAASIMVANFGTQVGPWIFPPQAHGGDGRLDVAVMKANNLRETLGVLAAPFLTGTEEERPGVELYRGREVVVRSADPVATQLDGEDIGDREELVVSLRPSALPILVSDRRPSLQWDREWPPPGFDWSPWERRDGED